MKMQVTIVFDPMLVAPGSIAKALEGLGIKDGDIKLAPKRNEAEKPKAAPKKITDAELVR